MLEDNCEELKQKINEYIERKETESKYPNHIQAQKIYQMFMEKSGCLSGGKIESVHTGWNNGTGMTGLHLVIDNIRYSYVIFTLSLVEADQIKIISRNEFSNFTNENIYKVSDITIEVIDNLFRNTMNDLV